MAQPLITIEQARGRVLAAVDPLDSEVVSIADAVGRILAEAVIAAGDVPPFSSSAMDGYAVEAGPGGRELRVVAESRAGAPAEGRLQAGQAIRISTGAVVPEGAQAIIPQELVQDRGQTIVTEAAVAQDEHVRPAGEVMRGGATILQPGTRLRAAELAAAVTAGAGRLTVAKRPVVQVLSTGDELRDPGDSLGPGQIHNSNSPMLVALASAAGAIAPAPIRIPDDSAATEAALASALSKADVVIVSGGVSVGPHDHVKPALTTLSVSEHFWGVALQPGKPTWFGARGQTLVFGLPGNPVSAAVTFVLFAQPAIEALQGASPSPALDGH